MAAHNRISEGISFIIYLKFKLMNELNNVGVQCDMNDSLVKIIGLYKEKCGDKGNRSQSKGVIYNGSAIGK